MARQPADSSSRTASLWFSPREKCPRLVGCMGAHVALTDAALAQTGASLGRWAVTSS